MWPTTASPERNCKDRIAIAQAQRRTLLAAGWRGSAHPASFCNDHVDVAAGIDRDAVRRDELAWSLAVRLSAEMR
jgi:hypothetical protein